MLVWEEFRSRSGRGLCRFDACMRRIQRQEWARFVQVWCKLEKDSDARVGEICAGLMLIWEGFRRRSERGVCRFGARMIRMQTQEWVRFVQFWCLNEKDSDARVVEVCAVLMLVWEGCRRTIGWGLCRFDACLRRIQTQEWVRFVQVWCLYKKNSEAGVGEVCAGLTRWEGFRRRSRWGLRRFDASMRRIQMQDWVRFVQVWCSYEKDLDAGVSEVCAGLVHAWEGFRRKSGWGLCRLDACMRRIQAQEWVRFVLVWCLYEKDSDAGWVRFVQVWCVYERDSDAGVGEVCAGLMLVWEGFWRRSGWGFCRFDARMRRIQTQEWLKFVQFWCLYEKDSDARLGEVCAGLMLVWEGFRSRSGWGLCRFDACMRRIQKQEWVRFVQVDACMRRIQTQEWVRFVQVWCKHEKDSDAGVGEVCAGFMPAWEGFRRKVGEVCAGLMLVWEGSDTRVGEVCAGLTLYWAGFRGRSGWGLCRFDASMRKNQMRVLVSFAQVSCKHKKDSNARVVEVCAVLMLVQEGFRRRSGWGLCRFDAYMRRIQTQEWVRFRQVWCLYEKDSNAGVDEVCAGLMLVW